MVFCPLPEPKLSCQYSVDGTELQLYRQHLMKQIIWYQNPYVENSLPDCGTVCGVTTPNTPCKLSSQLYCLQTDTYAICVSAAVRPVTQSMAITFVSHRSATVMSVAMSVRSSQLMSTYAKYRDMKCARYCW
jgi:hypothetical protein